MKTNLLKYLLVMPAIALASCNNWLDITPKGRLVLSDVEDYARMFDYTTYINYGLEDIAYLNDEMWVNTLVMQNGWNSMNLGVANIIYKTDYDRSANAAGNTGNLSSTAYQSFYERITKVCNTIIYDANKMKGSAEDIKFAVAQAKAYRAFNYFLLVNYYAKPYNSQTAASDGAVPVRLNNFVEMIPIPAKSTVEQVYAQIQTDIDDAINSLPESASTPYRFNKAAGYALKAKVHLFKKEFNECLEAAKEAYRLNPYITDLPTQVPVTATKPAIPIYATDKENLFFAGTTLSYFLIHRDLINIYTEALTSYGQAATVTDARWSMYQQPPAAIKDYQFTSQWMPTQKDYSSNAMGLRTSEVVLMMAECYARKGDYINLKSCLEPYFKNRYRNYIHADLVVPNNVTDAVKMVIKERRKELTKGCNRFFDLRRLNTETAYQTVPSRTIPGDPSAVTIPQDTYYLPVNSPLYVLPFPSKVKLNDPRLTDNTMN